MNKGSRILVAGARGLVGSAIVRSLRREGYTDLLTPDRQELDFRSQAAVDAYFSATRPELVFLAAARVGGIAPNSTYPADFVRDNLQIQTNAIDAAWRNGARKLLYLGSSCIYPKLAPQPLLEEYLLTGPLEPTNEWYAIAKIAGLKMCQAYRRQYGFDAISVMPTNVFGPGDNFDLDSAHVVPALIRKVYEARERGDRALTIWGTGTPRREFIYSDDLADACLFLMQRYSAEGPINVGWGVDVTIRELAHAVMRTAGYEGQLEFDASRPDGTPRKVLDTSRLQAMGFRPQVTLEEGLRRTFEWYASQVAAGSVRR